MSFREALLTGLAPDGGLYLPVRIPELPMFATPGRRAGGRGVGERDFRETARKVLSVWLDGILDGNALGDLVDDAFDFPVPIVPVQGLDQTFVLELFHGPTLSFKDFGARFLGRMLGELTREPVTILVATSGDTGSAVADGCSGIPGVRVVLLYPKGQVSPTQERQLMVDRPGVTAVRINGSFDDCQRMVKGAFSHPALDGLRLTTANSINIGRLLPQMVYYIHTALQFERPPLFVVPSGNLGNLTAGVMAGHSGMAAAGFVAAHNENDFFPRWLADRTARFAPSRQTLSNAMDVGAPSNFERLEHLFRAAGAHASVQAVRVSDAATTHTMRLLWERHGYLADPHTAVGLTAILNPSHSSVQIANRTCPVVVLSTAHPAKFPEIVKSATGQTPDVPVQLAQLEGAATRVRDMDADGDHVAELIRSIY